MAKFNDTAQLQIAPAQEARYTRPITRQSDVTVPIQQALWIGTFLSVLILGALYGLGVLLAFAMPPALWAVAGLMCFSGVTLWAFLWRLGIVTETLQHWTEAATGVDLDGDGSVGAHGAGVGEGPGTMDPVQRMSRLTLPFIRACYEGGRNGRAGAQPKLREAGFTDDEIEALRDALVRQGIAAWVNAGNHKSGLRLLVDFEKAQELGTRIVWLPNGKSWND